MSYTNGLDNPELYFQVKLYTGNGSADHAITLGGDTDMQPDLTWIKGRSGATEHVLTDSVRGVTKELSSNDNGAEETVAQGLTAFGSDGFTVGTDGSYNTSSATYASWNWKESATAGFDIVGFTGNNTARTISHSLSAVPSMIIHKDRDVAQNFLVTHKGLAQMSAALHVLNTTEALGTSSGAFNGTAPTSSVFSVGANVETNADGSEMICYLWSEKQGFSRFSKFVGNGSADGTFVFLGFKPAFVMIKRSDGADYWYMFDNKRDVDNVIEHKLEANEPGAEHTSVDWVDFTSNGFKLRYTGGGVNASGGTYIFMAFAEAPFVNSNGVPCNAR